MSRPVELTFILALMSTNWGSVLVNAGQVTGTSRFPLLGFLCKYKTRETRKGVHQLKTKM